MASPTLNRLGLGTAQLGMDYGITNDAGRVTNNEACAILRCAAVAGVNVLDTASLYGDSEKAIGRQIGAVHDFSIITKTPKFTSMTTADDAVALLKTAFDRSLSLLDQSSVHGLLFHDADDLLGPFGPQLWNVMQTLKAGGLVEKIGASVYDGSQIDRITDLYEIDLVQVPYNILDRRLEVDGQLRRLADAKVEVHARSLFLQGLLLQDPVSIPTKFGPLSEIIGAFHRTFKDHNLSPMEGIFASAFQCPFISRFICGVTSAAELDGLVQAANKALNIDSSLRLPTVDVDPRLLNPSRWGELD